ncbi:Ubiquitin-conjugating enzyme E2 6 [Dinochytrium kinnereticum]|nr:Ubiquitin-conjugating enzyme E2 6 [Dinochytrium kinnereticum]
MASKGAYKRLAKEYMLITQNPPPFIQAKPLEDDILEWHYVVRGPPDSPYAGGEYHGKLIFPDSYPYKPPGIKMFTPNGRFQTDYRLCLSMSDYHPASWNPAWSVATILTGLLSFMLEDTPTTGSIKTTTEEKRLFAIQSHAWNRKNSKFRAVFPELCIETPLISAPIATVDVSTTPTQQNEIADPHVDTTRRRVIRPTETSPSALLDPSKPAAAGALHHNATKKKTKNSPVASSPPSSKESATPTTLSTSAALVLSNAVIAVRSRAWGIAIGVVLLYLVVVKVMSRVALAEQRVANGGASV